MAAALAITAQTSKSEEHQADSPPVADGLSASSGSLTLSVSDAQARAYKIYSLAELGEEADLGKWIAETIPEVIEPGTWKGQGVLRYYAPKNILVVYHTPAVQAKVDGFLKNVKKSMPSAKAGKVAAKKASAQQQMVVPASYRAPALLKASTPAPEQQLGYAVPAPVKAPKHLFHFIIRYEGDGIIDDNVVKFMKAQLQANKKGQDENASPVSLGGVMGAITTTYSTTPPTTPSGVPSYSITPPTTASGASSAAAAPSGTSKPEDKKADKKDKEDKAP
ncbi:MAG TPA: hypothetical protein VH575_22785 [Gemmataceae bacterium]